MPNLEFRATYPYSNDQNGILVPVTLKLGDEQVSFDAKLDTGAQYCLFQGEYEEVLGLEVDQGERLRFRTVNSPFDAFGHQISMKVVDLDFELFAYFFEDSSINRSLLGRTGWLPNVRLGLVDYNNMLYLSHYDD